ncbi:MAG: hypothetical protein ABWY45_21215 [Mycobacterium sp.]
MGEFTDEMMQKELASVRPYSVVILRAGPRFRDADAATLIWEHGRRNFGLRQTGELAIVLPAPDDSDFCGVAVFTGSIAETVAIMNDDPGVLAGVFVYEVRPCVGFPGDALP